MQQQLLDLKRERNRLAQHQPQQMFGVSGPMSVQSRLFHARYDPDANAYGPTPTQRDSLNIARDLYADVHSSLTGLVDGRYDAVLTGGTGTITGSVIASIDSAGAVNSPSPGSL